MDNPCLSFVMARMGRLGSPGIGLCTVSPGFANIRRKTSSTSATVCVMSTCMYTGDGSRRGSPNLCRVIWLPETALNTGKGWNPNVAVGRGPHKHGGGAAGNDDGTPWGSKGHPGGRVKPGVSECPLPDKYHVGAEEGCPHGRRTESDCTLGIRHLGAIHGRGIQRWLLGGRRRSTSCKSTG